MAKNDHVQRANKPSSCVPTKMFDHSNERSWPEFFKNIFYFWSRSFIWVVKHFCRSTRNWFFSSLNMGIFAKLQISPFCLISVDYRIKPKTDFFFRQLKRSFVVNLQKCLTTQMKDLDLNFLKKKYHFQKFSSKGLSRG